MTHLDEAFEFFYNKIHSINSMWVLSGSYRLFIEGAEVKPSDIDILTTSNGVDEILELLSDYAVASPKKSYSQNLRSYFGKIQIGQVRFEISGDIEEYVCGKWKKYPELNKEKLILLDYHKMEIPVFKLSYEKEISVFLNHKTKSEIISELMCE